MSESANPVAVEQLSQGLGQLYEPHLKKVQTHLQELVVKQEQIQTNMTMANDNFSEQKLKPTREMMQSLKVYKDKLLQIKKQMVHIHQKTRSLKKRATFIKEFKTKELEEKIRKRAQEEALIANNNAAEAAAVQSQT